MNTEHEFETNSSSQRDFNNEDPRWRKPQSNGCMDTGLKVGCGFILGVLATSLILLIIWGGNMHSSSSDKTDDVETWKDYQTFELSTKNGVVTLHSYMSKDSVKILMGRPHSISVTDLGSAGVNETWEYKGRNSSIPEFTMVFSNGKLESVDQYREP